MGKIRIQKALSDAGVISRRKAEELIKAGKITVNGHRAEPGNPIDIAKDVVVVEGKRITFPRKKENLYIMLHKPRGYVTTTSDELGRRCVTELVEELHERVYPVGRLDKNTEGLLLMTNDGQFANMLMHPSSHVTKTYRLTARPDITDEQAARLAAGVNIGEGEITQPAQVHIIEKEPGRVVLQISVTEGKNRQIRRMCEAVGLEVARLKRVSVGPQKLGMLQPGQWRELTKAEVLALRNAGHPIEIPNEPGTGRDSRYARHGGKPIKVSDPHVGSHSFGTDERRGTRRKDGFVGKKEKTSPYLDDYSFSGGYSKRSEGTSHGKPAGYGDSEKPRTPGAKKPSHQGPSSYGKPTGGASSYGKPTGSAGKPYGKPTGGAGKPYGKPTGGAGKPYGKPTGGAGKPYGKPTGGASSYGKPSSGAGKPYGKPTGKKTTPKGR